MKPKEAATAVAAAATAATARKAKHKQTAIKITTIETRAEIEAVIAEVEVGERRPRPANWEDLSQTRESGEGGGGIHRGTDIGGGRSGSIGGSGGSGGSDGSSDGSGGSGGGSAGSNNNAAAKERNTAATKAELESEPAEVEVGMKRPMPERWDEMSKNQKQRWRKRRWK